MRITKIVSFWVRPLVALAALGILVSASAEEKPRVLSGTVEINSTQLGFIITGRVGGGVLEFEGKDYNFDIGGLGVGGAGVSKLNAVGAVYDLDDISKFSGTYVQARAGGTIGSKGRAVLTLSNQHGVSMDLKGGQKGLALMTGADGVIVKLKK